MTPLDPASPLPTAAFLVLAGVLPALLVLATAFTKILVVLGILRAGIGLPEVLPTAVTSALAAVLALIVMTPTANEMFEAVNKPPQTVGELTQAAEGAWPPLSRFLARHTRPEDEAAIIEAVTRLNPKQVPDPGSPPNRVAAFAISELTAAFQLGVVVLLPFLIIDLLTANTLVALGFTMLAPSVVALPFKLLLFVAVGGWSLLLRGLIGGYA